LSLQYLMPSSLPPTREDYEELYAQFIALILSTGKTEMTVPHRISHPKFENAVKLIQKRVDQAHTTYIVTAEKP
jgi:hypothetical protein